MLATLLVLAILATPVLFAVHLVRNHPGPDLSPPTFTTTPQRTSVFTDRPQVRPNPFTTLPAYPAVSFSTEPTGSVFSVSPQA